MSDVVLDASALMAMLNTEPGADLVFNLLPQAAISAVNFAEVISKLTERGIDENNVRDYLEEFTFEITPFDAEQAYDAGILRQATRSLGLSLGDRCCLSLARNLSLPVLTADRAWAQLSIGVEVNLVR